MCVRYLDYPEKICKDGMANQNRCDIADMHIERSGVTNF